MADLPTVWIDKLTAAPWNCEPSKFGENITHIVQAENEYVARLFSRAARMTGMTSRAPEEDSAKANAEFIALARNAFDVMMRRGWGMQRLENGRWVLTDTDRKGWLFLDCRNWFADNPYHAAERLVEADRWYKENFEKHS